MNGEVYSYLMLKIYALANDVTLFFGGGYARMEAPSLFLCDCESGWVFLNAVYAFRLRWVQYESTFANSRSHDDVDPRHAFLEWKGTDFIHNDHLDESLLAVDLTDEDLSILFGCFHQRRRFLDDHVARHQRWHLGSLRVEGGLRDAGEDEQVFFCSSPLRKWLKLPILWQHLRVSAQLSSTPRRQRQHQPAHWPGS